MGEFVIILILFLICDLTSIYETYVNWVVKEKAVSWFPFWRDSKKPLYWFIGWGITFCLNVVIFVVIALIFCSREWSLVAGITGLVYTCAVALCHTVIRGVMYLIYRRKNKEQNEKHDK